VVGQSHLAPLIVMLTVWLLSRLIGTTGLWLDADSWTGALRVALAAMFVFTAISHFHPRTRSDLIRMVPATLPGPAVLVSSTGVLEFLGAIGLMLPRMLPVAAYSLIALLVAMFPANIHAARQGLVVGGRHVMPLFWRLPLQLFWIAALWWVASPRPSV
jgi:uncharacterized membrane protein